MRQVICFLLVFFGTIFSGFAFADHGNAPFAGKNEHKPKSEGSKIISTFKYPSISWQVPKMGKDVERLALPNGMVVYLREDHNLPLVTVEAVIRTGTVYETKEKFGTAGLTGTVMRTGGTVRHAPDEFDKELEYMDAQLSSSFGTEEGIVTLKLLSQHLEKGLELFSEMLRTPLFSEEKFSIAKSHIREEIRRKNDLPAQIVRRGFLNKIYGDHPYAWEYEWNVVSNINKEDLIKWHNTYVQPNNILVGVSGDFKKDELLSYFNRLFGDWPKKDISFSKIPQVAKEPKPGVFVIPKEQNQTYINIGHLGINRTNPDRYPIEIMNYILGGGSFTSRITEKVRNDEGLAYSVGSRYLTGSRDLGTFTAYCQTKVGTTHKAIDLILKEISKVRSYPVSDVELQMAKDSIVNRFLFGFTSPHSIVSRLMMLEYEGMPLDYYEKYRERIQKVSKDDILRVAKTYLRPNEFTFVLVGNLKEFDKSPGSFGKVEIVPVSSNLQE